MRPRNFDPNRTMEDLLADEQGEIDFFNELRTDLKAEADILAFDDPATQAEWDAVKDFNDPDIQSEWDAEVWERERMVNYGR